MRLTRHLAALVLAGFLALGAGGALAQQGNRRTTAQPIPQVLLAKLKLTEEQSVKVKAAEETFRAELQKAGEAATPRERRMAQQASYRTYLTAVKSSLNEEQVKSLDAMLAEAAQFAAMGNQGARLVGLNLTDEQRKKVSEIAARYQPERQKLNQELRQAQDKAPIRQQLNDLNRKMMDDVREILTDEQKKQLQSNQVGNRPVKQ